MNALLSRIVGVQPEKPSAKQALLYADGQIIQHGGKRYRIEARETYSRYYGRYVFACHAQDLDPQTPDEAKFCLIDLWSGESEDAQAITAKAVALGTRLFNGEKLSVR